MLSQFSLKSRGKTELINITSRVAEAVTSSDLEDGMCTVFIPHTTAGVTINEAADPSVATDILKEIDKIVPFQDGYRHLEGNSAAHIKSSIVGVSCQIPVLKKRLVLGTWQGIYFCEFDGPRSRTVFVVTGNA
jgi:secondary thiamine-phosphate synthase enzyme